MGLSERVDMFAVRRCVVDSVKVCGDLELGRPLSAALCSSWVGVRDGARGARGDIQFG